MSKELNATCSICGKRYFVCSTCRSVKTVKPWRTITDTIECYKIYMIVHNYKNNAISKEEARKQLKECTLPGTFQDHIKIAIDEINSYEKKNKAEIKKGNTENNLGNNEQ